MNNENLEQDDVGGKWSLSALWKHMRDIGIDMEIIWTRIYDIIIKVIITGEYPITKKLKQSNINQKNCFELYGFDILLDSNLKPWLIEVNLSPSLGTDSPLDYHIKSTLLTDTFNLIGIRKFDRKKESLSKMASRVKNIAEGKKIKNMLQRYSKLIGMTSSSENKSSPGFNNKMGDNNLVTSPYENDIFYSCTHTMTAQKDLIAKNKFCSLNEECLEILARMSLVKYKNEILDTLEERCRMGNYIWIYPAEGSNAYDYFFINVKPVNVAIYEFMYSDKYGFTKDLNDNIISEVSKRLNFKHVQSRKYYEEQRTPKSSLNVISHSASPTLIDYMIEYLAQIIVWLKSLEGRQIKVSLIESIWAFVNHKNWSKNLITAINTRSISNSELISKMIERLEDTIYDTYHFWEYKQPSNEQNIHNSFEFAKAFIKKIKKAMKKQLKPTLLKSNISDTQLEEFIRTEKYTSTMFNQEMIKTLIPEPGSGALCKLRKLSQLVISKTGKFDYTSLL